VQVPGSLLRGDEGPGGNMSSVCVGGIQERDSGAVRAGPLGVHGGSCVHGGTGLLSDVLQADAGWRSVHGAVPQFGGNTAATGKGG
jgi:hypothetical protein